MGLTWPSHDLQRPTMPLQHSIDVPVQWSRLKRHFLIEMKPMRIRHRERWTFWLYWYTKEVGFTQIAATAKWNKRDEFHQTTEFFQWPARIYLSHRSRSFVYNRIHTGCIAYQSDSGTFPFANGRKLVLTLFGANVAAQSLYTGHAVRRRN